MPQAITAGDFTIIRHGDKIIIRHLTGEAMQCDVAVFAAAVEMFYTERF